MFLNTLQVILGLGATDLPLSQNSGFLGFLFINSLPSDKPVSMPAGEDLDVRASSSRGLTFVLRFWKPSTSGDSWETVAGLWRRVRKN